MHSTPSPMPLKNRDLHGRSRKVTNVNDEEVIVPVSHTLRLCMDVSLTVVLESSQQWR